MASGYSRSPKLLKGALIQFSAPMLIPIPNIIIFQYNPETMTRQLSPWVPMQRQVTYDDSGNVKEDKLSGEQLNQLSQPFDPQETFSLVLELDATDALEEPSTHPIAVLAGVADRISAMEMLCYPPGPGALGGLLNVSVNVSIGAGGISASVGTADAVPRLNVPIVLFFWGPGRIVPVRITSFSVEEQQYSPLLYPVRAKVTVGLKVLDENHLLNIGGKSSDAAIVEIAKACYKFTQAQKEALAMANLANSVESIIGMLPF
ncbi:MAG TPA: hypothetical protein VLE19_11555 [Pyrinomonadaceae bacterium]|nr:hypothetical protein [Pyrinomonadaceae bacterium]